MARPDRGNRPRIAGQRRTADRRPDDLSTPPEVALGAPEVTPEARKTDVTTATLDALGVVPPRSLDEKPVTESKRDDVSNSATAAPGRRLGLILSVTLAVLIVLILAFAGVLGVKALKGKQAEDARGQAAAAGRKAAETALSYDYRSLDRSFAAARATMTPDFAAKFDGTAKVAGELATKTKATVRAEVREVGVRDGDADRVTLIIFVNQTTTSTITQGKPRVDLNRTRFTMVRNGNLWLVQEIAGL